MERTEQLADDPLGWGRDMKQLWEGPRLCPCLTKPAQAKHTQISSVSAVAVQRVIGIWFVHPVDRQFI